jgi:hypothetical protein
LDRSQNSSSAGFYTSPGWGTRHPRLQLLTIADILSGKQLDAPPIRQVSTTFRRAPRKRKRRAETAELFDSESVQD